MGGRTPGSTARRSTRADVRMVPISQLSGGDDGRQVGIDLWQQVSPFDDGDDSSTARRDAVVPWSRRRITHPVLSSISNIFKRDRFVHQKLSWHVLNICAFYYDSRRYFCYIVRCPSSHYWLYATLISSLMMMMMMMLTDSDSVYWTCSQKAKNQKAKQTIMHCIQQNNTIQDKKWNAMQCNAMKKMNQGKWYRPIGIWRR